MIQQQNLPPGGTSLGKWDNEMQWGEYGYCSHFTKLTKETKKLKYRLYTERVGSTNKQKQHSSIIGCVLYQ